MKKKRVLWLVPALCLMSGVLSSCVEYQDPSATSLAQAASMIAKAGQAYGGKDAQALLEETRKILPSLQTDLTKKVREKEVIALMNAEFSGIAEKNVGARKFEAYPRVYTSEVEEERTSLDFLSGTLGIYSPAGSLFYSPNRQVNATYVATLIDRFHAYMGTSEKDDFFSTVNHDFLYDKCQDDGGFEDLFSRSNLIPISAINSWAKNRGYKDALDLDSTYLDTKAKTAGNCGGLVAAAKPILEASDMTAFVAATKDFYKAYSYCPLWGEVSLKKLSQAGKQQMVYVLEPYSYSYDPEYKPGSESYNYSKTRFTNVFKEFLGGSDSDMEKLATDYSDFKYKLGLEMKASRYDEKEYLSITKEIKYGDFAFDLYGFMQDCGFAEPGDLAFENALCAHSVLELFSEDNLPLLKGLAAWALADHYSGQLSNAAMTAWMQYDFEDKDTVEKLYYRDVTTFTQYGLSKDYLESETGQAEIKETTALINTIKTTMIDRISNSFLGEESRAAAKEKSTAMYYSVAGQGSIGQIPYFEVDFLAKEEGGTYFKNRALFDAAYSEYLFSLTGPYESNRENGFKDMIMGITPLTGNAYYAANYNGMVITLGYIAAYPSILTMSEEDKLATFGWVVGHELSHGYDSTGVYFDKDGNRVRSSIFTRSDLLNYLNRVDAVASFYDGYEVMPGRPTNGKTVVDEAVADINGLNVALDISKQINGFDYKAFFRKGASSFASYATQAYYASSVESDVHPFGRARVNCAFATLDKFHETFETKEGDGMYVSPAARIVVY
ncbi:MAG: M13 family metallopeptidase [Erysipelotrichaceae bacterium]|jgi:predicted metalloendopeptidase|nr:M13 family metallopeptidase [Erysipelotrichaceae bacterium]